MVLLPENRRTTMTIQLEISDKPHSNNRVLTLQYHDNEGCHFLYSVDKNIKSIKEARKFAKNFKRNWEKNHREFVSINENFELIKT
jgi:hypothetical protein